MANYIQMLREDPLNAWYYVQGTTRMWAYNNAKWLLRSHISEQFEWRKKRAKKCYDNKTCLFCGCKTPDLFFANKACGLEKVSDEYTKIIIAQRKTTCFPRMMSKQKWNNSNKKLTI